MGIEIERKFLVKNDDYKNKAVSAKFRQGYLSTDLNRTVRIRLYDGKGYITIKGKTENISREEYEYEIPPQDADKMLDSLCLQPIIEKYRYFVEYKGFKWIIDEFAGVNCGLVVAEIELEREDEIFERPDWTGKEITGDSRYFNSNLVNNPYKEWK